MVRQYRQNQMHLKQGRNINGSSQNLTLQEENEDPYSKEHS